MYHSKQALQKTLATKVALARQEPVLALKGEPLKVSPQAMLAALERRFGKKG